MDDDVRRVEDRSETWGDLAQRVELWLLLGCAWPGQGALLCASILLRCLLCLRWPSGPRAYGEYGLHPT